MACRHRCGPLRLLLDDRHADLVTLTPIIVLKDQDWVSLMMRGRSQGASGSVSGLARAQAVMLPWMIIRYSSQRSFSGLVHLQVNDHIRVNISFNPVIAVLHHLLPNCAIADFGAKTPPLLRSERIFALVWLQLDDRVQDG